MTYCCCLSFLISSILSLCSIIFWSPTSFCDVFVVRELIWSWKLTQIEYATGKVILEAVILTAVVVVSLTLYTFWAVKRGQDFNFLGPFLFGSIIVLMVFGFIQVCIFFHSVLLSILFLLPPPPHLLVFESDIWLLNIGYFLISDILSPRENFRDDLWLSSISYFLRIHCLWYR